MTTAGGLCSDVRVGQFRLGCDDEFLVLSYEDSARRFPPSLTAAERAVAGAAVCGRSNAQIAADRGVSERTVANQMAAVLKKLGMRSRLLLAAHLED